MPRPPRQPAFWLAAFLLWFGVLWWLSSTSGTLEGAPSIPHLDKIIHFGYFFGGAGLLSAFLYRLRPHAPNWPLILTATVVLISLVGVLDEYHQSFVPGRDGNSPGDLAADFLGGLAGALVFRRLHHLIG